MRGWSIDQKLKTLSELSRLADQYVAVHQADCASCFSLSPKAKPFHSKAGQGNFQQFKPQARQNAEERVGKPINSLKQDRQFKPSFHHPNYCKKNRTCHGSLL